MISSIEGRSSMGSTFTRHCWLLVVRSSAHLSNSAACARAHSILAHRLKGFMWTSSIEPTGGRWLAASSWLMPSTPRTAPLALCRGLICSRENRMTWWTIHRMTTTSKSSRVVQQDQSSSSMRRYGIAMVQTGRPGHGVRYKPILSHEQLKHRRTTIPGACVRRLWSVWAIWRSMFWMLEALDASGGGSVNRKDEGRRRKDERTN